MTGGIPHDPGPSFTHDYRCDDPCDLCVLAAEQAEGIAVITGSVRVTVTFDAKDHGDREHSASVKRQRPGRRTRWSNAFNDEDQAIT